VRLDVAGDGRVRTATVEGEAGRALERCLAREARRLTFPAQPAVRTASQEEPAPLTVHYRLDAPASAATGATTAAPPVEAAAATTGAAPGNPVVARSRASRVRATAELTQVQVRGGSVAPSVLESVVRRNVGQLAHCHAQALDGDPGASGTATVRLDVGADGRVTEASVRSTLRGHDVESCIRDAVRHWSAPMPIGRGARVHLQVALVPRLRW
jgi:hypothetical protein